MINARIIAAAAALTVLAGSGAMAQDISPRGAMWNRGYDSNAYYGDSWSNNSQYYRGGYARYGSDWDNGDGYRGPASAGIPTRSDRGASNGFSSNDQGAYRSGYAQRNGFVCQPGSVFMNENGQRTLCQ